jgi:hypothetical protein
MYLKPAVTQGEIEFGLELSQHGEADIAEGSDEVGEHRDVNRHRFCSLSLNICRVPPRGQKGLFGLAGRCNFLGEARLC